MKKTVILLLSLMLMSTLAACGNPSVSEKQEETFQSEKVQETVPESEEWYGEVQNMEQETKQGTGGQQDTASKTEMPESMTIGGQETEMSEKTLVVYFSCTGTTKPLAEYAADILEADLYEIVEEEPYTDADLAYYTGGRADQEQNDPDVRPAISGSVGNMESYNTVLIGYPIWHGQAPRIISTFLERYDFSGKTIIPFCTSHSSGIGSSAENLHGLCSDSAEWLEGRRFEAGTSRETMEEWLDSIGIE